MSTGNKTVWGKLTDKAKEAYNLLKVEMEALKIEMAEVTPTTPVKMGEANLQDGTVIKYTGDTLAEGSEIILVTPEGEIPAPEGDLILADGSICTISIQDGKSIVTAVKPAEAPAEMNAETAKQVSERVTKIVEKFEAQFKTQEDLIKSQSIQIENLKLKLGKVAGSVIKNTEMLIEFGALPTTEPIEKPLTSEKKTKNDILLEKFHKK